MYEREQARRGSSAPLILVAFVIFATLATFAWFNYSGGPEAISSSLGGLPVPEVAETTSYFSQMELGYLHSPGPHNPAHDVGPEFADAWNNAVVVSQALNGGDFDPDRMKCFILVVGNKITRAIVWTLEYTKPNGFEYGRLLWWHASSPSGLPEWGGSYSGKSLRTMTNIPKDVASQYPDAQIIPVDSCDLPTPPGLAY